MDAAGDATVADAVVAVRPGDVEVVVVVLVGWWWWVRPVMILMLVLVGVRKLRKAEVCDGSTSFSFN